MPINTSFTWMHMARKLITVFYTNSGTPQGGLSPRIDILQLHPTNPGSSTTIVASGIVVEVGLGWYRYDFTTYDPTMNYIFVVDGGTGLAAEDRYKYGGNESYAEDISTEVWNETLTSHTASGTTGLALNQLQADVASIMISEVAMTSYLELLLKYERNRTRIDTANSQLVIYDDDGTTPLTTFDLRDFNGMPSVQEVCERIPV